MILKMVYYEQQNITRPDVLHTHKYLDNFKII